MNCCNNNCLEFISPNCIEVQELSLTTLETPSTLTELITQIDAKLSSQIEDVSTQNITIDLKCLGAGCVGIEDFLGHWTLIATASGGNFGVTLPFDPGLFILEFIKIYANGVMINSVSTYGTPVAIPGAAISSGFTATISVMYNSPNGMIHFVSTLTFPANLIGGNSGDFALNCVNSTVTTLTVQSLFQILIDKLCT